MLTIYDITDPVIKGEFDMRNMSYAFKLNFHTNNTEEMKDFIHKSRFLRIRANNLIFLSKDQIKGWNCRGWEFLIEFDFITLEIINQRFDPSFEACDPEEYININEKQEGRLLEGEGEKHRALKKENIILREIFFVNVIAFIFNMILTMQIINVTIDVFRHRKLKEEKMRMYRWLLRERKNFDIYVKFQLYFNYSLVTSYTTQ